MSTIDIQFREGAVNKMIQEHLGFTVEDGVIQRDSEGNLVEDSNGEKISVEGTPGVINLEANESLSVRDGTIIDNNTNDPLNEPFSGTEAAVFVHTKYGPAALIRETDEALVAIQNACDEDELDSSMSIDL
jgi:hypothetical protein